ncbi:MAG: hypothetical protein EOP06_21445, partial [Proteobacteria bacterium]
MRLPILILIQTFAMFVFVPSTVVAGLGTFLAKASYSVWNEKCPEVIATKEKPANPMLARSCARGATSLAQFAVMQSSMGEISENAFFGLLAQKRHEQFTCTDTQLRDLTSSETKIDTFVKDFDAKLTLLGQEKRRMLELKKTIGFDKVAAREYELSSFRAAALIQSLTYTDLKPMQDTVSLVVAQYETYDPSRMEDYSKHSQKLIRRALLESQKSITQTQAVLREGATSIGSSLSDSLKESLAQDKQLIEETWRDQPAIQKELIPLACHVDAKYGKGAVSRDNSVLVGSLLLSAGTGVLA